jgi:hypothetical protein
VNVDCLRPPAERLSLHGHAFVDGPQFLDYGPLAGVDRFHAILDDFQHSQDQLFRFARFAGPSRRRQNFQVRLNRLVVVEGSGWLGHYCFLAFLGGLPIGSLPLGTFQ